MRLGGGELDADTWSQLRASIWHQPLERRAVRQRLLALTGPIRERLGDCRPLAAEWAGLGVEVREAKMAARGMCSTRGEGRVIYVNERDPYELQRFTVAHELGHMLLTSEQLRRRPLSPREEETLCEEFASRLLIDRETLATELGCPDEAPVPEQILRLCGRFRVNVRPMMIATGEQLADTPYRLLLARWRGHWRRPSELAFRVVASAGARHAYFPHDQRLASLGLSKLASAGERAPHGGLIGGEDAAASVGLRGLAGKRSSACVRGRVRWRAIRQGSKTPFLLAVLDLGSLADPKAGPAHPERRPS